MEQRPLRLGDILDDYCPRERRLTNHAVVAIVEDTVKQTRCTTCDAEHAYKGGREPRRRRKDATNVLFREVLAGMSDVPELQSEPESAPSLIEAAEAAAADNGNGHGSDRAIPDETDSAEAAVEPAEASEDRTDTDEGPIHRRLIRATLPRPEGQKDVRQAPDFTMRGPTGNRPGQFRGDRLRRHGGSGTTGRGQRFGSGQGAGGGRGGRPGFGGGSQHRQGGGRKRSR